MDLAICAHDWGGDWNSENEGSIQEDSVLRLNDIKSSSICSGGEQQRIAVARAIATDPEIILADEPTGNLDNENSMNVVHILVDLAHIYGKCVIIITHASEVADKADIVLKMDNGYLMKNN